MKRLFVALGFLIFFNCCSQSQSTSPVEGATINPSIQKKAEQHISESELSGGMKNFMAIFNTTVDVEINRNDLWEVLPSASDSKQLFKSFYYWRGDTLGIDGAFGLFQGIGFHISIVKNKATLTHMVSSDEVPSVAYNETDSLTFRIEVPCTHTKIILSTIPDSVNKPLIYGYVEFKSKDYYTESSSEDGEPLRTRDKYRANMKIYFKSVYMDLSPVQ